MQTFHWMDRSLRRRIRDPILSNRQSAGEGVGNFEPTLDFRDQMRTQYVKNDGDHVKDPWLMRPFRRLGPSVRIGRTVRRRWVRLSAFFFDWLHVYWLRSFLNN